MKSLAIFSDFTGMTRVASTGVAVRLISGKERVAKTSKVLESKGVNTSEPGNFLCCCGCMSPIGGANNWH